MFRKVKHKSGLRKITYNLQKRVVIVYYSSLFFRLNVIYIILKYLKKGERNLKIKDLNSYYDKLQLEYGDPSLSSIYNGGCEKNPDVCFVFMNPTGRNIASTKEWNGRRSPWIGTKNIWKLFYNVGLLDEKLYNDIQSKKPKEWTEEFADKVYEEVEKERNVLKEQAINEGKPVEIAEKMVEGRLRKFYEEICLEEQAFVKDGDIKVSTFVKNNGGTITDMIRYEVGEGMQKREENFAEEVAKQMEGK